MSRSYTVTHNHGCRLICGPVPVGDFVALVESWTRDADPRDPWLCDALLGSALDANFCVGPLSATRAWRAELGLTC